MELRKANMFNCEHVQIDGFNGQYLLFSCGYVYSKNSNKLLNNNVKPNGYRYVVLSESNTTTKIYIHRLVGKYFIPNPLNKKCINHKYGNKADNHKEDLEWCTHKENNDHAFKIGLNPNRLGILTIK